MASDLTTVVEPGRLEIRPHPGQWRAWNSRARFVAIIAGTQSGKTVFAPLWLQREIQACGAGDYLVASPTFQLLEKKALPAFREHFEDRLRWGTYRSSPTRQFVFNERGARAAFGTYTRDTPTIVWFGHAADPDSLESATVKAAWLDEAGQKAFKLGSWEAVRRRLSIHRGRALVTTTPYDLGWLKQVIWDRWKAGDPDYDVIQFDSTENPVFPQEEFENARDSMPAWKFDLFYRGRFTRPAGMIYDCFRDERAPAGHLIPRFALPSSWPRYLGLDFGGANTAGVFLAEEPGTRRLTAYRIYKAGGRTAVQHTRELLRGEACMPLCVGGSHSEDQWRAEFRAGGVVNGEHVPGLPVMEPPIKDVEVGINRVYGVLARDEIRIFEDLMGLRNELATYARELDPGTNEPTEKIEDKETFHLLDATRYIIAHLRPSASAGRPAASGSRPVVQQYQVR